MDSGAIFLAVLAVALATALPFTVAALGRVVVGLADRNRELSLRVADEARHATAVVLHNYDTEKARAAEIQHEKAEVAKEWANLAEEGQKLRAREARLGSAPTLSQQERVAAEAVEAHLAAAGARGMKIVGLPGQPRPPM